MSGGPGGGEPHGYDEFMAGIDTLVIGRKTFETVLPYPQWPYGDKRVVVLSSRPIDFSQVRGGKVEHAAGVLCGAEGAGEVPCLIDEALRCIGVAIDHE